MVGEDEHPFGNGLLAQATAPPLRSQPDTRSPESTGQAFGATRVNSHVLRSVLNRRLKLRDFCDFIESHQSLGRAKVFSTEGYAASSRAVTHRFVLLELYYLDVEVVYLRLDRRRSRDVTRSGLFATGGRTSGNDVAEFSSSKKRLVGGGIRENIQTFDISPTMGDLNSLLRAVCEKVQVYEVWPANCWSFVSLVQQYLHVTHCGTFVDGKLGFPTLANNFFKRIRDNHNLKHVFTLTEILRSLHQIERSFPGLIRRHISEALQLSEQWDGSGNYDTVPGRVLAHKLAENTLDVARQIDADRYAPHITLLYKESVKLLRPLYKRDPESYREQYAVSLHQFSIDMCRNHNWEQASHVARGAVRLRRHLCETDPQPARHCVDLASSLGAVAHSLHKMGRVEDARVATREMLAFRRQLYLRNPNIRGVELAVFLRDYGSFLAEAQSHLLTRTQLAGKRGRSRLIARS